ncbi:MAG: histidine--tRNA ligase [Acidobacteria bacterium]|nr:histidine--tRNA ligase [Acidobacteriota bacterium]
MQDPNRQLVDAQTLKGYRDILPEEMIFQNALIERVRRVLERYGFVPLDTPCVELLATLTGAGGEETDKDIIRFKSREGEDAGLRFDLTVPFARLLAQYPEQLRLPIRRYQLAPVFRNDKPGEGRYRQFRQFDFDAAGSESVAVDAEIVALMCDVFREAGVESGEFEVRVNNRKILTAIMSAAGIDDFETQKRVLRAIDKLLKIGEKNVRLELGPGRTDDSGDTIRGAGLPEESIGKILGLILTTAPTRAAVVDALAAGLPRTETAEQVIEEMRELDRCLSGMGIAEGDAVFYPSLARGLDYYTGPIFEAFLKEAPEIGAVFGGGRYDNLVDRFLEKKIPATGASFGLDRFTAAFKRLGKTSVSPTVTQVMVMSFPGVPAAHLLKVASLLRAEDIRTELYLGAPGAKLRDQLAAANFRHIPVAVIVGPDEYAANQVSVKDLRAGLSARAGIQDHEAFRKAGKAAQQTVGLGELLSTVKSLSS